MESERDLDEVQSSDDVVLVVLDGHLVGFANGLEGRTVQHTRYLAFALLEEVSESRKVAEI